MRIVTWNVNGLRAAIRKGIDNWFEDVDAEIWMLQETRVLEEQFPKGWNWPESHQAILHPAEKKGYSGVATLSSVKWLKFEEVWKASSIHPILKDESSLHSMVN